MASAKANLAASKAHKAMQETFQAGDEAQMATAEAILASIRLDRNCGTCGASTKPDGDPPDVCQGCKQAFFCSKKCSLEAWPSHKEACEAAQRERAELKEAAKRERKARKAAAKASSTEPRSDGASTSRGTT